MSTLTSPDDEQVTTQAALRPGLRLALLLAGLTLVLLLSITLGVSLGPIQVPFGDVWTIAAFKLGLISEGTWTKAHENIVWLIRFPRVLMAVFVGAGLAVVGVTMQALVRNPLADPYLLGISSGASVGAVLVIGLGIFAFAGVYAVSLGAFVFALLAFLLVFALARRRGHVTPQRLILAGLAVSYVFSGITSFITLTAENRQLAGQVLSWMLGSLARSDWIDLTLPTLVLASGTYYLVLQARSLNALLMGDETAAALGVEVMVFRRRLFVVVSLITGVLVAVSGAIGFIGLMIPHLVRIGVGSDHRRVLPLSLGRRDLFDLGGSCRTHSVRPHRIACRRHHRVVGWSILPLANAFCESGRPLS